MKNKLSVQLRERCDEAGVPNQMQTLPGAGHLYYTFTAEQTLLVQRTVTSFLRTHGVLE